MQVDTEKACTQKDSKNVANNEVNDAKKEGCSNKDKARKRKLDFSDY